MTRYARTWLRPNLGTDVAWINGMMHVIIAENLYDRDVRGKPHRGLRSPPENG